jgi:2-hydroxychromene-2-carboxylate isomerase
MAKKDFSNLNTGSVYETIAEATAEPAPQAIPKRKKNTPPTEEEIQLAREQGRTRGRAGVKALRINMAFTPEIHDYIRTMAQVRGQTVTQFTEAVFRKSMEDNAEIYEQAKAFQKLL